MLIESYCIYCNGEGSGPGGSGGLEGCCLCGGTNVVMVEEVTVKTFRPCGDLPADVSTGTRVAIDSSDYWKMEEGEKIALVLSSTVTILGHFETESIGSFPDGKLRQRFWFVAD